MGSIDGNWCFMRPEAGRKVNEGLVLYEGLAQSIQVHSDDLTVVDDGRKVLGFADAVDSRSSYHDSEDFLGCPQLGL